MAVQLCEYTKTQWNAYLKVIKMMSLISIKKQNKTNLSDIKRRYIFVLNLNKFTFGVLNLMVYLKT